MHDESIQDDILYDRLVDGELTAAERHALLASLDDRPGGWRRCALAFLEAQSWREGLGQFVRGADATTASGGGNLAASTALKRSTLKQGMAWLAIAASVLVAFALGTMRRDAGPTIATNAPIPSPATSVKPKVDDALTLFVRDESGQMRPMRVPLVDAATLDRQLGVQFQPTLPTTIRERLQHRGFDIQSKQRYAPLWLENGRPMIVPVEDTKIVPVGQKVY